MFRGNCDKCGENIFEVPSAEAFGNLPRKVTCLGCGRRFLVELAATGKLVFSRMGRKLTAAGKKRSLKIIEF